MINFPSLTIDELSSTLAIAPKSLSTLARDTGFLYRKAIIPKNRHKVRVLEIPEEGLKTLQRELLHKILDRIPTHPSLYGGPASSTKKAVQMHINKPLVIALDIKDFFPSIKKYRVIRAIENIGIEAGVSKLLADLITYHNHVPQGAPTSACIGRIVLNNFAFELDQMLKGISPIAAFSIYVDDIIISGPEGLKRIIPIMAKMLGRYGFKINREKMEIMRKNNEQVSLNIRLNKRIEATSKFLAEIDELEKRLPPWSPKLSGKKSYVRYLRKPMN